MKKLPSAVDMECVETRSDGPYRSPYQPSSEQAYTSGAAQPPHPYGASQQPPYYMHPSHYFTSQPHAYYNYHHGGEKYSAASATTTASSSSSSSSPAVAGNHYNNTTAGQTTTTPPGYGMSRYHHHQQQQHHYHQQQQQQLLQHQIKEEVKSEPASKREVSPQRDSIKPDTTTSEFEQKESKEPENLPLKSLLTPILLEKSNRESALAKEHLQREPATEHLPSAPTSEPHQAPAPATKEHLPSTPAKEHFPEPSIEEYTDIDKSDQEKDDQEKPKDMTPPPALIPVESIFPSHQPQDSSPQQDTDTPEDPKVSEDVPKDPNAPLDPSTGPPSSRTGGTPTIAKLEAAVKENLEQAIRQHNQTRTQPFEMPAGEKGMMSPPMPKGDGEVMPRPEEMFPFGSPPPPSSGIDRTRLPPMPHLPFHNIFQRSISDPNYRPGPMDFFPSRNPNAPAQSSSASSSVTSLSPPTPKDPGMPPSFPRPPPNTGLYMPTMQHQAPDLTSASPHKPTDFSKPKTPGVNGSALTPPIGENGELFYCHLCSYVGTRKNDFNVHMNSHFEHQCPNCDYTSRTEGRLKRHIKDFHTEDENARREPGRPKSFRCRQCDFVAKEKEEYWQHARTHIKDDKVLQCPKCPFVTEYKHHLEYHLRNHFGSKPFKCTKCNYSCVNKSMLNSHMKSHTNVYQYRCADCTYATKYCHSLKLHLAKYNHAPALVLNPDGSLPTDGSGDFELVSKRGPPRGPRGPRRSLDGREMSPIGGSRGMPMFPGGAPPQGGGMNGRSPLNGAAMLAAAASGHFWPGMFPPPPPLIPVSAMNPINIQMPGATTNANMSTDKDEKMKCKLCEFTTMEPQELTEHMFKVHATENRDLFKMFGLPGGELTEQQLMFKSHGLMTPPKEKAWGMMNGMYSYPRSSPQTPHTPVTPPTPLSSQTSPRCPDVYSGAKSGDHPLDLTMGDSIHSQGAKRRLYEEDEDEEGQSPTMAMTSSDSNPNTPMPNGNAANSPPPKKKSRRKGKAYKLDVLKMQEQRVGPVGGMMSEDEEDSYPGDMSASPPPDYSELHDSLRALNGPRDDEHAMASLYTGRHEHGEEDEEDELEHTHGSPPPIMDAKASPEDTHEDLDEPPVQDSVHQFECHHCHISFRDCILYTMHMGYHGYQDPFKCNMCGQCCKDKVEFFLHIARTAHE